MLSSYQVVLWKQESFVVLCSLRIEFFRILLGLRVAEVQQFSFTIASQESLRMVFVQPCSRAGALRHKPDNQFFSIRMQVIRHWTQPMRKAFGIGPPDAEIQPVPLENQPASIRQQSNLMRSSR